MSMNRIRRAAFLMLPILSGILPVLVYSVEHGGLGVPSFGEYQTMTKTEQLVQILAGLYIKPTYMLISLALIIGLWRQTVRIIVSLFWGLSAFLVGEIFCALNFILYRHESLLSEYIHSYGMVLAFAFVFHAMIDILDFRLRQYRLAARRITIFVVLAAGILCFLPLSFSTNPRGYLTDLFGYPYAYARFDFYQWVEARALPWLALAFLIGALISLLTAGNDPFPQAAKIFFSAGIGSLGFSIFRITLGALFATDLVWFEFWEELTELMFVSTITFMLWQFRPDLVKNQFSFLFGSK